jgi:hypothetical protein
VSGERFSDLSIRGVRPEVVEIMRELDSDLADRRPRLLTAELAESADVMVMMGCGDACRTFLGTGMSTGTYGIRRARPSRPCVRYARRSAAASSSSSPSC